MTHLTTSPDCTEGNCTLVELTGPSSDALDLNQSGYSQEPIRTVSSWPLVKEKLQWSFPLHVYGFALLFAILAFYTFFSILNLRSQLTTRPFMSTINVFVCVLGLSRTVCFVVDPYGSLQILPHFVLLIVWDLGYPCILSAFCLIQLAFSQLTQMKFRPQSLRRETSLSIIIVIHFSLALASDVAVAFDSQFLMTRTIIQNVFLLWGVTLCLTFLYGGTKLLRLLKTLPNSAFQTGEQVEHKGILQLALLAQCNNIASSVITAAAPSILAPKIKITDENNQTFSVVSEASKLSSPQNTSGETAQSKVPQINITKVESPVSSEKNSNEVESVAKEPSQEKVEESAEAIPEKAKDSTKWKTAGKYSLDSDKPQRTRHGRRKKSLTWSDGQNDDYKEDVFPSTSNYTGATLGQGIQPPKRQRGGSDSSSSRRSSSTSTCSSRKNSSSIDSMSRKGSYCSIGSFRHGSFSSEASSRKDSLISEGSGRKGSHVGEALIGSSRRNSSTSDVSCRRSSHNLGVVSSSSRRGSSRSVKEDTEGENLLRRNSNTETDLTLNTILNHIAYANQATPGSKIAPPKFKESRKEQVRQVLIVTYFSAILGMFLSILLCLGLLLPDTPVPLDTSWIWFSYESVCRFLEFFVGCAMANITRQSANRHTAYGYSLRMKPRNSIYM